ncbi:haloacid dehalogenase-like hydrolase (HAD) superfamily protein [Tasmannia lanceolata]|uniref:haloacid dehalogenase-like hydrolase (HAD) superfamily protein n=1 Tax=Tasmannia lanceolata TaxID=3420 RepID=UPI004062A891
MSPIVRSRLFFYLSKNRTLCSSTNPPKEPLISSSSLLNDQPPPSDDETKVKRSWNFLKLAIISALTGASATAGYASYAYTLDEVDHKTRALRESANYTVGDDASALDKIQARLYSTAMTVPAKFVELYMDIRRSLEEQVRGFTEPSSEKLLPDLHPQEQHVFTLVLDLNETLIYSDWKRDRGWRTFKRPGVEDFLKHLSSFYEIVVYSDQLNMYVDPIVERLDKEGRYIRYRLSRAATRYQNGKHYRDLSKLNRDPSRILYVSGHALESSLQPENGVPIKPWKLEPDDTALLDLIPFLEYVAQHRPADIRSVLASYQGRDIATEFAERSKEYQRRMQEQKRHGRFWGR